MKIEIGARGYALVIVAAFFASGCKKDETKADDKAGAATTKASGCGADYADPMKEFCVKIPAEYNAKPQSNVSKPYSEMIDFDGPMSGYTVSVGTEAYEDEVKIDEQDMKAKDVTVESTGATKGTGKWWLYKKKGYNTDVLASVKSNSGKVIRCKANNMVIKPEVLDACKTLRPYPQ